MFAKWDGRVGNVRRNQRLGCLAGKRRLTGQQFVGNHAKPVDVGPVVDVGVTSGLFGRHVARRSQRNAGHGQRFFVRRNGERLRDSEISDQGVPPREHHVVWFDIAMDDALRMSGSQCVSNISQHSSRFGDRKLALAQQTILQRAAFHVRHHVVDEPVGLPRVINGQHVRMRDVSGNLDFLEEPFGPERCQLRLQNLEGHLPAVPEVAG